MAPEPDTGPITGRRRRDIGTVAVVLAVVVVVAVLVAGRLGAGGGHAAATTIFPASSEPTTAPRTTTTVFTTTTTPVTTVPEVAVTTVRTEQLATSLLPHPAGVDLFVWSNPDQLVRIEVDRGLVTRTNVPRIGTGQVFFLAGAHDVIIRPEDNVPGYRVPDGEEPEPLPNSLAQPTYAAFPGPDVNHYWISYGEQFNALLLVDRDGQAAAAPVGIPGGFVTGPDGTGQIIVQATGGAYVSGANGFTRVTSGQVIAAGATALLTLECDEHLVCSMIVIDRASGRRVSIGPPGAATHAFTPGVVSPDGRHAAYAAVDRSEQALYVLDLTNGRERKITDILTYDQAPGAWSHDGRYFFYIDAEYALHALDVVDGTDIELVKGLPPVTHLVSRVLAAG